MPEDRRSPTIVPTVVSIHLAPARRAPVRSVPEVVAEVGAGLVGDRYHGSRHRHVTVQSAESLAEAAVVAGLPVTPERTRRNVTLSHGTVPATPGSRILVGEVVLEVVRVAAPCRLLEETIGPGGAAALRRRGGSVCRILAGGTLRVGDSVELLDAEPRDVPPQPDLRRRGPLPAPRDRRPTTSPRDA